MSSYQFTPQAVEDLFEIWSYIALDDSEAANRVEEAVYAACAFLADTPLAGRIREDLTSLPLRFWLVRPYRNYWIVYHPETKPLQVIRILHAARTFSRYCVRTEEVSLQMPFRFAAGSYFALRTVLRSTP